MTSIIGVILAVVGVAAWAAWVVRAGLVAAQIFQIEEYEAPRLFAWGRQPAWSRPRAVLIAAAIVVALGLLAQLLPPGVAPVGVAIGLCIAGAELNMLWRRLPAKKPIVYTPRMRRILGAAGGLLLLAAGLLLAAILALPGPLSAILVALACLGAPRLALALPVGGDRLMAPVERSIQAGFVRRAKARIGELGPRVVGIAGSYGKTSTKHIAGQLLAPQVETLPTPKSFNTLMGITRTINEHLEPRHRLFLVEMDAYAEGEIAAMCGLVGPELAVITSVGPQHLERFGTVERIGAAIYELAAALPRGAPVLVYAGDPATAALAERAAAGGLRALRYGIAGEHPALDVLADEVQMDGRGAAFTWRWPAEGLSFAVRIPLLGRHNVQNVTAALALVHLLGHDVARAARDAARLEFVPHRLQIIPGGGGVTVIDDSYNANPVGVRNGLEVLRQMGGGARILVTPGLVELGSLQEQENRRYGALAAQACDHVILVGRAQTEPILAGLREGGMAPDRVHVVQSLEEVTALLGRISRPGDVVLFANDLPDTYLEL